MYESEQLKLSILVGGEQYSKDVPAGCIISQEPPYAEDFAVKEGSTITVVISKGRNLVKVPKVVGKKVDEATTELEALGLFVNVEEEYNKKVEAGYVTEQSVEAKKEIDAGETITIKVSKGVEKVIVPDLLGKTEDVAKDIITESGLKLKYVYTDIDENRPDGVVIYQDLDPNTEVDKDSYINISINVLPTEKKATINVNVKSLLGGAVEYENILDEAGNPVLDENGNPQTEIKNVKLEIRVNDSAIYSDEVSPLVESISAEFTNKGWVDIKVLINGIKKADTGMYLENQTSITID